MNNPDQLYRLHYPVIAPLLMCHGIGDGKTTACIMAQAATIDALRNGKTLDAPTDEMECACPVLRRMAIKANDASWWTDDADRTEFLRPLIPLLLDSRVSEPTGWKRIWLVVDRVVRDLTPMRLDFIAEHSQAAKVKKENAEGAAKLRALTQIVDRKSAVAARDICSRLRASAYTYAYADASAYAYADASASASAYASAYAYADAYADAYTYAYTYAYADASADAYADAYTYADAQKLKYRTAYLQLFRDVAAIKVATGGQA